MKLQERDLDAYARKRWFTMGFLHKAAAIPRGSVPVRSLCMVTQVEDTKSILKLVALDALKVFDQMSSPDSDICQEAHTLVASSRNLLFPGFVSCVETGMMQKQNNDNLVALTVTYLLTHGVYEEGIDEIGKIIHENGSQVYMEGAKMNA
uniref:Uncharacterized protein n=1 Tax=Zea mays TaxID=4577 RepID=A0A804PQ02_MAIZE